MLKQCKFISPETKKQCGITHAVFSDGFCIHHSASKEAQEARERRKTAQKTRPELSKISPFTRIHFKCLDCSDGLSSLYFCPVVDCSLWLLRFGKTPETFIKHHGETSKVLFDPKVFEEAGIFGSAVYPDECLAIYKKLQGKQ